MPRKKYSKNTVRKNVTLKEGTVDLLERLSQTCGLTQSQVLEVALSQPLFRRTRVFLEDDPIGQGYAAAALVAQTGNDKDWDACHTLLDVISRVIVGGLRPAKPDAFGIQKSGYNTYIFTTIPDSARRASPFMEKLCQDCIHSRIDFDDGTAAKTLVRDYIMELLRCEKEDAVAREPKLYQILSGLLSMRFEPQNPMERKALYLECARNGLVLSEASLMDTMR